MKPTRIAFALGGTFATCIVLSSIHPWGNPRAQAQQGAALLDGSTAPEEIRQVLAAKCADCHSANTHYPPYSRLAPVSWLVERDIQQGREHLNMSEWQRYSMETRIDLLAKIASEVRSEQMPVRQYLVLHPQARLTPEEEQTIYDWAKAEHKQLKRQVAEQASNPTDDLLAK